MFRPWLDRLLFRQPFEGRSARSYVTDARPAFGDLDRRLLDRLDLHGAKTLLDVGAGPAAFALAAHARHPHLHVIAVEPSRDLAIRRAGIGVIRAAAEALPLPDRSIDHAVALSSIRHVRDRAQTLRELRRVVRGTLTIVELDPAADAKRIANHANRLGSPLLRRAFGPLVCKTAPPARVIEDLARAAGFARTMLDHDPIQPVYILELA